MPYRPAVLKIPPPLPRKGRPKVKPLALSPTPPALPLTVNDVIDLSFDGPSGVLTVVLDVNLGQSLVDPQNADPAQWTVVYNSTLYVGTAFTFDGGGSLTISFADLGTEAGPNVISYRADPSDIEDSQGRKLAAFENYPI